MKKEISILLTLATFSGTAAWAADATECGSGKASIVETDGVRSVSSSDSEVRVSPETTQSGSGLPLLRRDYRP